METIQCIKSRTSIRRYKPEPITDVDIRDILEAAISAPSSGNSQDWEFIVVKNSQTKDLLSQAAFGQEFVSQAPLVIVVCCNYERNRYGERGKTLYCIQNTAAAIENMLLAAWDKEIGSCWVGAFNEGRVKEILLLPENVRPLAIITLGYPDEKPEKPGRLGLDRVVHWERY